MGGRQRVSATRTHLTIALAVVVGTTTAGTAAALEVRPPPRPPATATVARVQGIGVTVVSDAPVVADALRAAGIVPRDGALVSAGTGRVIDAHANPATIRLDGGPVGSRARLRPGGEVRVENGASSVEPVDVRTQAALPTGLPDVENTVWQPGTPGLDEITTGRRSGEVVARRTLVPAGHAVPNPGMVVALTFDDGPSPDWTPQVLDVLRRFGIKSTFCTVGYNQRRHPELVRLVVAEGHTLCNHTAHHAMLDRLPLEQVTAEITDNAADLRAITGQDAQFFRAPGGRLTPQVIDVAHRHGERVLGWNVDPRDYERPPPEVIRDRILSTVKPGAVVILHDGGGVRANTVAMLPDLILRLIAAGYSIVPTVPGPPPAF
jgi:peptidoglycan/xylan/chitin deacetylase (PgdA/CDA1 family)